MHTENCQIKLQNVSLVGIPFLTVILATIFSKYFQSRYRAYSENLYNQGLKHSFNSYYIVLMLFSFQCTASSFQRNVPPNSTSRKGSSKNFSCSMHQTLTHASNPLAWFTLCHTSKSANDDMLFYAYSYVIPQLRSFYWHSTVDSVCRQVVM